MIYSLMKSQFWISGHGGGGVCVETLGCVNIDNDLDRRDLITNTRLAITNNSTSGNMTRSHVGQPR